MIGDKDLFNHVMRETCNCSVANEHGQGARGGRLSLLACVRPEWHTEAPKRQTLAEGQYLWKGYQSGSRTLPNVATTTS